MMFYGKPNELVKIRKKVGIGKNRKTKYDYMRFSDEGTLIVEDEKLIERMKKKYKHGELPPLEFEGKKITLDDVEDIKRVELFKIAKNINIDKYWQLTKDALVEAIKDVYKEEK